MRDLLEEEGYRVSVSLETLDLDRIKALAPDVIVQDLLFAGMQETGWHFLTLTQLDPELAHLPLILCTAATEVVRDPAMAENLNRLGVRVLLKPFHLDDLLTIISETLVAQGLLDPVDNVLVALLDVRPHSTGDEGGSHDAGPPRTEGDHIDSALHSAAGRTGGSGDHGGGGGRA